WLAPSRKEKLERTQSGTAAPVMAGGRSRHGSLQEPAPAVPVEVDPAQLAAGRLGKVVVALVGAFVGALVGLFSRVLIRAFVRMPAGALVGGPLRAVADEGVAPPAAGKAVGAGKARRRYGGRIAGGRRTGQRPRAGEDPPHQRHRVRFGRCRRGRTV